MFCEFSQQVGRRKIRRNIIAKHFRLPICCDNFAEGLEANILRVVFERLQKQVSSSTPRRRRGRVVELVKIATFLVILREIARCR